MTVEISRAFGNIAEQINELGRRIDNLYAQLHLTNAENIDTNAVGLDGLAETVGMQSEALNDLAAAISELE